jgi:NTE family protein
MNIPTLGAISLILLTVVGWPLGAQAQSCPEWTATRADTRPEGARPRVGLVLGGGGARGAAHIGVLRQLEAMRIPIDAIAGISMGALVGGLYSSGLSVAELEEVVRSLDWQDAFRDAPKREALRFRRKQDDEQFPIGLELGVRGGALTLPRGAIEGQKLSLILRSLTLHVPSESDFQHLPVPFRAVASDLETGQPYEMCRGDLARAMRASMSAPGIFSPVTIDGHTLVDGGLGGNVPVETMRRMGVDIIIAVDVEFPLFEPDQLNSALDISAQMLTILIRNQTQEQLATLGPDDFLLRPELDQFGSTNFAHIVEAIEPGAIAAAEVADELRRYSLGEGEYAAYLAARQGRRSAHPENVDYVRVVNQGELANEVLQSRLQTVPGDPVDALRFAADADAIYGLNTFEQVSFRLVEDGERTGVEFSARAKSWGPNYLLFGVSLQDDFEGQTAFNLSARLTRTAINSLGAEWRNDIQLGTDPYLRTEFYQPLSFDSRYFLAPRAELAQTNFNAFADQEPVARYRVSGAEAGIDAGRELGRWGEFRVGAFIGTGSATARIGDPALPRVEADTGGVFAKLAVDTLDDAQIPLHGARVDLAFTQSSQTLGADDDAGTLTTDVNFVRSRGRHTFQAGAMFNTSLEDEGLIQNFFPLGGFLNLSGLASGEISGPHAGVARIVYYRRSGETGGGLFDIPLYFGASAEAGNVWASRSDIRFDSLLINGSLFAGLDTYFGPLFFGAGFAEGGKSNFYLSLGGPAR